MNSVDNAKVGSEQCGNGLTDIPQTHTKIKMSMVTPAHSHTLTLNVYSFNFKLARALKIYVNGTVKRHTFYSIAFILIHVWMYVVRRMLNYLLNGIEHNTLLRSAFKWSIRHWPTRRKMYEVRMWFWLYATHSLTYYRTHLILECWWLEHQVFTFSFFIGRSWIVFFFQNIFLNLSFQFIIAFNPDLLWLCKMCSLKTNWYLYLCSIQHKHEQLLKIANN